MVLLSIAAAIIALTLIVMAGFMVPTLLELRKTAVTVREVANRMENELKPVIQEVRDTLAEVKFITGEAATKADDVKIFMEELGNAGRTIRTINNVVGGISGILASSSLWFTGAKVAGKFIADKLSRKRG
jgi:uncharacterized protein YoxC